jgi:aminopeptidase N
MINSLLLRSVRAQVLSNLLTTAPLVVAPLEAQSSMVAGDRLAPGVSLSLAQHRARTLSDVRYDVRLSLPNTKAEPVGAQVSVTFTRRDTGAVILDFDVSADHVKDLRANGVSLGAIRPVNGHLNIPATALRRGRNLIAIRCIAGDVSLNRNDDFLYTVFVPARARQALPVFDQPDLKARFTLQLTFPESWSAVANGAELSRETVGSGVDARTTVRFQETPPLPTYLFAFAAGRFQVDSARRGGRLFRMFHRERDSLKVARNRDVIFDLHAQSLAYMESYTGIAYPWGKFDVFLAPSFQFGGMEHAGAIFYNASGLMLDASATQAQLLGRASVIAHETAHLWFGDLVTMRWFDDVWLKEVFANFYAAKIVNPAFPLVNHPLRFLLAHYPPAYDVDRTSGANPIRQPLDNLANAGSLYGAIIYQKAPIMMRQLEQLVGEASFRDGMRTYLSRYAYHNATWPDLVRILDARTPVDLRAWSRAWVSEPGRPEIRVSRSVNSRGSTEVVIGQHDPRERGLVWPQQIAIAAGFNPLTNGTAPRDTVVARTLGSLPTRVTFAAPTTAWVIPSANGLAYGDITLDSVSRSVLLERLPVLTDALQRGSALVTLWEEMQEGRVRASDMQRTLLALMQVETDELLTQRVLSYWESLWSRWLPPATRLADSEANERALRAGLTRAGTASAKLAWFRALMRTAQSESSIRWLTGVWQREIAVTGLTIGEDDETALALQLALREVLEWSAMLDSQRVRITNPDRAARFEFVRRAVSSDSATRAAFFASLRAVENRRREPWVLEGLSLLHHPLRASGAEAYVAPSLDLLEEIERTGDIFLPKRWLDVTLGGHRSPRVGETVRAYLRSHPTLSPRLRAIVLQSADELWRVTESVVR